MSVVLHCFCVANQIFRCQFHARRVDFEDEVTVLVYSCIYQLQCTTYQFLPLRVSMFINTICRGLHSNYSPFTTHKIFMIAF